jgi:hypothetical protein
MDKSRAIGNLPEVKSMQLALNERRKAPRYQLRLPLLFSWSDGYQIHTQGGFTRDVSINGLFVTSAITLPPQTILNVEIVLPTLGHMAENTIRTSGHVVRLSGDTESRGFAITAKLDADLSSRGNPPPLFDMRVF